MGKLRDELKQSKPFRNLREEAILNVWRTADFCAYGFHQLLKTRGLSQTQYNVLRILRGAGEKGLPSGEIAPRMLTRDPDVTRLMDRLVSRGLARRARVRHDRRVVLARLTKTGADLLAELEGPVAKVIDKTIGHMPGTKLKMLIALLEQARGR